MKNFFSMYICDISVNIYDEKLNNTNDRICRV